MTMKEKLPDALRSIGEASIEVGVKSHILRYWEEQFPMLKPLKRAGGRRYYRREDIDLLRRIVSLLNEQGYTVRGAVKYLQNSDRDVPTVTNPAPAPSALQLGSDTIAKLQDIRRILAEALAA